MNLKKFLLVILLSLISLIYGNRQIGVDTYGAPVELTTDEIDYLEALGEIKISVDPNWMPYESIKNGRHIGIISDYIKLFSKRLDIKITLVPTNNYRESRERLDSGEIHIISADVATEEVISKYLVTNPYIVSPRVFALRSDIPRVNNFEELLNMRIGVQTDSPAQYLLSKKYPDINLFQYPDTDYGLRAIEAREIDAFVTIIGSISHSIEKQSLSSVKIGGEVLNEIELSILINRNYPKLVSILNKAILTITPRDRIEISEKWIIIRNEGVTDYRLLFTILGIFLVISLFVVNNLYNTKKYVTMLKQKNSELEKLSLSDPLTGIMNRRAILQLIQSDIYTNLRSGLTSCLIMFDIDHFKRVNDTYGHDAGDEALVEITNKIKSTIRKNDFMARWGGEEFLILASGTSLYNASHLGEKIRATTQNIIYDNGMKTTISVGIAEFTNNEDIDDWVKRVDNALYKAKDMGRNCVYLDNLINEDDINIKNPFTQVKWKEEYRSGNMLIDNQHRDILVKMSNLSDLLIREKDRSLIIQELTGIIASTEVHFRDEENILQSIDYQDLENHREEHRQLLTKANGILEKYSAGETNITETLSFFYFDLIAKHIFETDSKYFRLIKKSNKFN